MDRILAGALAFFAVAAILIGWGPAPGVTAWAAQAVLVAAFTTLSWRLAQRRGQGARRRRFWEAAAVAGLILTAGAVLRAVESVTDPASATAIRTAPGILLTVGGRAGPAGHPGRPDGAGVTAPGRCPVRTASPAIRRRGPGAPAHGCRSSR
ncbi:hypothetical protein Ais01nite_57080 [Asanoa ishikariensis]|uniref:hypothetical protein n=1 Tax=Asanoa ishikariensis TaxID=137265 RepID=UPI0015A1949B|nr:hypothetical protein [Asanoa ishikariensis]GIF67673.1 hypothetical protein Ais01nite_57080 [Asanoa ishikariensis]